MEFIKTRTKVHRLDKGYVHIPKMRDFIEDPKRELWGNHVFWAYEVLLGLPNLATALQEVGVLPTLVYFQPYGCFKGVLLC